MFFYVIEEARRVLQVENTDRSVFGKECTERLLAEIEMMLYFGIHKGLKHPKSPKLSKFKCSLTVPPCTAHMPRL